MFTRANTVETVALAMSQRSQLTMLAPSGTLVVVVATNRAKPSNFVTTKMDIENTNILNLS